MQAAQAAGVEAATTIPEMALQELPTPAAAGVGVVTVQQVTHKIRDRAAAA